MTLYTLKLIIVHHHFRPGGVRRVIELATPYLVSQLPEEVDGVVLVAGEAPDPAWLKAFRASLHGTRVKVMVVEAFGYTSELATHGENLERLVDDGVMTLLRESGRGPCLIWAHNLGLGRNLYLSRELTYTCRCCCVPLVVHHHDWWFENRWHHFTGVRERGFRTLRAMASAVLASSPLTCHVAINQSDATVLEKHLPGRSGWLPNPVERPTPPTQAAIRAARSWLSQELGDDAPVWIMPSRLLRRKNVAEALLLARWLRPQAWLVTTGGVSSAEEQAYAQALASGAQKHGWRLRLGVLPGDEDRKPPVADLVAASEAVLITSLQEGFGLPYLEAAALGRPLLARQLPNVAPDLEKFGFKFPQSYRELWIDPSLFDWSAERARQVERFAKWKRLMPDAAARLVGKPALLAAGNEPCPVPFSRLTLAAQLEILTCPIELSWDRCSALNRSLNTWRKRASAGRLETSPWPRSATRSLGGRRFAERLLEMMPTWRTEDPARDAGQAAQREFLRRKLRSDCLYPLLWDGKP